jgi:hypothetical protein
LIVVDSGVDVATGKGASPVLAVAQEGGIPVKWAYCRLVVENIGQPRVPTVVNRAPELDAVHPDWAKMGDGLDKWMDTLGSLGWELAGVLSSGDTGHLLFRRPY